MRSKSLRSRHCKEENTLRTSASSWCVARAPGGVGGGAGDWSGPEALRHASSWTSSSLHACGSPSLRQNDASV